MNRFFLLVFLTLTACSAPPQATITPTATLLPPTTVASPTAIESPTVTEVVDAVVNEPLAHTESATEAIPVKGTNIPITLKINTYQSILDRATAPLEYMLGFDSWFTPTGRDPSQTDNTAAKEAVTKAWSEFVYRTWWGNATQDQKEFSKALFGKEPKSVSYEEYWKAVDAYIHNTQYRGKPVTLDDISYRVYTHVEGHGKTMEYVNLDPSKTGALAATDNKEYMSRYKVSGNDYDWYGLGSVVNKNKELEIRVLYPVNIMSRGLPSNSGQTNAAFIMAMNRLSYPIDAQKIGDISVNFKFINNIETYNPDLYSALYVTYQDDGYGAIGPVR